MKKLLLYSVLACWAVAVHAQIDVDPVTQNMSLGAQPAMQVVFSNVKAKLVENTWTDFVKDNYGSKSKWNRKAEEWMSDDARVPTLGLGNPVDLYAAIKESKDDVEFTLWVDLGGTFLSREGYRDQYDEAEKLLDRFATEIAKAQTREALAQEEKQLEKLESELKKLVNANERYHKEIEKAKEAIKKAESDIEQNDKDQKLAQQKIEDQKKAVDSVRKKLDSY
jgi:DNA repair exonuclease SbcCD ATPase subunit